MNDKVKIVLCLAAISLWGFILSWLLGGVDVWQSIAIGLFVGVLYLMLFLIGFFARK